MRRLILIASMACCLIAGQADAAMTDYCQSPPFISTSAAPNVLLMVDTNTRMTYPAYKYDNDGDGTIDPYISTKVYEGYFDPTITYILNSTDNTYYEDTGSIPCPKKCISPAVLSCNKTNVTGTCESGTNGCSAPKKWACCTNWTISDCGITGNFLNYTHMARIDLLRWAMTGGKPDSCTGPSMQIGNCVPSQLGEPGAASLTCDATGCTITTSSFIKVKARWSRITGDQGGLLYQFKTLPLKPSIGSMYLNNTGVDATVYLGYFTGSASSDAVNPYKGTIGQLNYRIAGGESPLGPGLWAAYDYLSQSESRFGSPAPASGGDNWKDPMYQCFDDNNDGNCQGNEIVLVPCAKNFIIVLSDGQWNRGGAQASSVAPTCSIDTAFENPSADPVVPAYWLHKKGFLNAHSGRSSSVEAIYGISLWQGGTHTGERSLQHVSMYGGFNTSQVWPGNMTDYPRQTCTVDNCGAGKGSPCTPLPPSSSNWDTDGDSIPDTYFAAADALQIKNRIMTIVLDILKKASSGTAVSVLSSSEGSGANLMQALFYPSRSFAGGTEVSWTSDLMNYWYYLDPYFTFANIREDTIREGADAFTLLDLKQDYITNFAFDTAVSKTLAQRWQDATGTGTSLTDKGKVPIEETVPIWRAGFNLWWTDPAVRNIKTSIDGSSLISFDTTNNATLAAYLGQTAGAAANETINYVRGYDCVNATGTPGVCGSTYPNKIGRSRTVTAGVCSSRKSPCNSAADCPLIPPSTINRETCTQETNVWKLGDIISSTPRILGPGYLNNYNIKSPFGYNDTTYGKFIKSTDYQDRQLAFVGANDGMLHAFKLGKLLQKWTGKQWYEAAKQEGATGAGGIGTESYAFIPKNVLPYLQYLHDEDYCHIYMVDGPTTLTDVTINKSSDCGAATDYWNCPKLITMKKVCSTTTTTACTNDADCPSTETCVDSSVIDFAKTSWRTTLIGSMGIGGATCNAADSAATKVNRISTPLSVSGQPVGWSSYFALDVTDQATPKLLWEFSNADLGVTNVGPAIVKVGGKEKRCAISNNVCTTDTDCGVIATNGKCVTSVDTNGRWFAILASGSTGPISTSNKEFKGTSDKSLKLFVLDLKTGALLRTIDTGVAPTNLGITNAFAGSISTSALDLEKDRPGESGNYQDDAVYIGYVKDTTNGGVLRLVINDDVNPANWTVSKVIDGIGPVTTSVVNLLDRKDGKLWLYFAEGRYFFKQDDLVTQRRLFGVQETCFTAASNSISSTCTTLALTNLRNQTTPSATTFTAAEKGWYVNMNAAVSPISAERVISNPTPDTLGAIYFLSFAPTTDVCSFGGTTYLWALDYKTGGKVTFKMQGKALVQVSTGEIKELNLSDALTESDGRKSVGFKGIPPTGQGLMVIKNPDPIKKFMHVQEQ